MIIDADPVNFRPLNDPLALAEGAVQFMNHGKVSANVKREIHHFPWWGFTSVPFYTLRDISNGEELLWDYGDDYWVGRGVEPIDSQ